MPLTEDDLLARMCYRAANDGRLDVDTAANEARIQIEAAVAPYRELCRTLAESQLVHRMTPAISARARELLEAPAVARVVLHSTPPIMPETPTDIDPVTGIVLGGPLTGLHHLEIDGGQLTDAGAHHVAEIIGQGGNCPPDTGSMRGSIPVRPAPEA